MKTLRNLAVTTMLAGASMTYTPVAKATSCNYSFYNGIFTYIKCTSLPNCLAHCSAEGYQPPYLTACDNSCYRTANSGFNDYYHFCTGGGSCTYMECFAAGDVTC